MDPPEQKTRRGLGPDLVRGGNRGLVLFLLQNKGSYELERLLEKIRWRSHCPLFQRSGLDFFIELEQQTRRGHDHLLDQETTHGLGPILEHEMRRVLTPPCGRRGFRLLLSKNWR